MDTGKLRHCRKIVISQAGRMTAGIIVLSLLLIGCASEQQRSFSTPVTQRHIEDINQRFQNAGIVQGYVVLDSQGRLELQGEYQYESEVDKAFSIAQTVVGVRWVSPVTPEHIKVTEWSQCLSNLFSGRQCGPPSIVRISSEGTPPGPIANKYALVVGIGKFKNPSIQTLEYASKDAEDMYRYLIDPQEGRFEKEHVILFRAEDATREAIKHALDEIRQRAQEDDLVFLYFSSHGTPPDKFGGVHIVAYDTEVKPRERVWQTSLTEAMLREFIQEVRAKRFIVVMDACYSNGAYSQIPGFLPTGGKSLGIEGDEGHGRSRIDMAKRLLGAKDLVIIEDRPQPSSQPEQTTNSWGKVLISASDAGEKSWESNQLHNSFFTHYFVEGLNRYRGSIKEAFDYAEPLVQRGVKQEKEADQNPQLTPSRRDWNISIAVLTN